MVRFLLLLCQAAIIIATQMHNSGHHSTCNDLKGDLCWFYNDEKCVGQYEGWARTQCPYRCGYCDDSPPCVDILNNCEDYEDDLCTNPTLAGFVRRNCRKYCSKCTYPGKIPTVPKVTTIMHKITERVSDCMDDPGKDCWAMSDESCVGKYEPWAKKHCPYRCGYCKEKPPCINVNENCDEYQDDLCTNRLFGEFARKNCRKYCNLCYHQINHTTQSTEWNTKIPISESSSKSHLSFDGMICEDKLHNCAAYDPDLCVSNRFRDFAWTYCREFCFGCPVGNENKDSEADQNEANSCKDVLRSCDTIVDDLCTDEIFANFSRLFCSKHCNICEETKPCVDVLHNCDAYGDDLCTNDLYADFALQYCSRYCDKCESSSQTLRQNCFLLFVSVLLLLIYTCT